MNSDPFIGTWELDPDTLDYQFGRPGRCATYVIEAISGGLLFRLDAEDADKNPIKVTWRTGWTRPAARRRRRRARPDPLRRKYDRKHSEASRHSCRPLDPRTASQSEDDEDHPACVEAQRRRVSQHEHLSKKNMTQCWACGTFGIFFSSRNAIPF